jgi:hypothetical protein
MRLREVRMRHTDQNRRWFYSDDGIVADRRPPDIEGFMWRDEGPGGERGPRRRVPGVIHTVQRLGLRALLLVRPRLA